MKQAFNLNGKIVTLDIPIPAINDYEILVRNVYSAISSGTETASIESAKESLISKDLIKQGLKFFKEQGFTKTIEQIKKQTGEPVIISLGYSCSGVVTKVGKKIADIAIGDVVACGGAGYANHAEFIAAPRNLVVKIPEGVDSKSASFTTIGAIALQGIRRADVHIGDNVAVIGLGLLGQIASQILTSFGCNVIGIDIDEKRVELAKKLGLKQGFVSDESLVDKILYYTENIGVDSVIIYASTKSSELINDAMKICRKKGTVVVVGAVGMDLKRDEFYKKELDFRISTSYGPGRYDPQYEEKGIDYPIAYVRWTENRNMKEFLRLLKENLIDLKPLINKEYSILEAANTYKVLQEEKNIIGVVFSYPQKDEKIQLKTKLSLSRGTIDKSKINVGVIGCGSFAKNVHLPNIKKIPSLNLIAVCSKTGKNARTTAEQFGANYCTTDYKEIIDDEDIDLVVITTRHNLHAPVSIAAAKAKKDIFVEKPMAMNYEECKKIANAVIENKVLFSVGFNRRFSPLSLKAKELFMERSSPAMINYVVNAGKLPLDHWVHDPVEGGDRMIGEACHFFDLLYWFIESEPLEVFTKSISSNKPDLINDENFITTIKFADGSTASLTYSSLGHPSFPKERIEIFANGNVIVIDDFKSLIFRGSRKQDVKLKNIDKGHYNELVEFAKAVRGEKPLSVTVEDGIRATICSLKALESLKTQKPQMITGKECI